MKTNNNDQWKLKVSETLLVLPLYNERDSIVNTLNDIKSTFNDLQWNILIVNDGSTDDSVEIIEKYLEQDSSLKIIQAKLPYNCGVGAAMRFGFNWANNLGYKYVIQFDADGQHAAESIPNLLLSSTDYDIVIGNRFVLSAKMTVWNRRLAIRIMTRILQLKTGLLINDPTSGFRLASQRAIRFFSNHYPTEYLGDTVNSTLLAYQQDMKIGETIVLMRPRLEGKPSASTIKSLLYFVRSIIAIVLTKKVKKHE